MHGYKRCLSLVVALACGVTGLTASAFAAPPSAPPGQADKAPPGQEKKAEQAPAPAATAPAPAAKPAKGVNATTEGKKPSSTTSKDTKTTVGASPDVSKRYGNGKTAAQIAKSRGAPDSTEIRGPGNSQPHKVCKNGHWVDVHAVKSYSDNTCAGKSATTAVSPTANPLMPPIPATAVPVSTPTASSSSAPVSSSASVGATSASTAAGSSAAGSSTPAGGVLGAQHTEGAGATGGVAGAFKTLGSVAAGSLPFTGFPLWAVALIGVAAVALGWLLWRRSRGPLTTDAV